MAGRARSVGQQAGQQDDTGARAEGGRSVTLDLPLVTAQFRAPDLHVPSRDELGAAARGAWSMMPSRSAMLFYGGLAVTVAVGAIEWPVAAAIGVGSALASRGAANPQPGGTPQTAEGDGHSGDGNRNGNK